MKGYARTRNKTTNSLLISLGIHLGLILVLAAFIGNRKDEVEPFVGVDMFKLKQPKIQARKNISKPQRRMLTDKRVFVNRTDDIQSEIEEGKNLLIPTASTVTIFSNDEASNLVRLADGIQHTLAIPQSRKLDNAITSPLKPHNMEVQKSLNPEMIELGIPYRPIGLTSILTSLTPSEKKVDLMQELLEKVKQRVEKVKTYPHWAREAGYEGTAKVQFTILADGKLGEITLINSSGYDILDKAAIATIKKAVPFPSLMDSLNRTSLQIELPIAFRLSIES